jgi:hypothetical protein
MPYMTTWTKNFTREPAKTKAELREMLAEAVRNTATPEIKSPPQAKRDRGQGRLAKSKGSPSLC